MATQSTCFSSTVSFPSFGFKHFLHLLIHIFFHICDLFLHPKVLRYSPYGVVTYYQTYLPTLFGGIEFIFVNTQWLITHGVLFFAFRFCFNILQFWTVWSILTLVPLLFINNEIQLVICCQHQFLLISSYLGIRSTSKHNFKTFCTIKLYL